MCVMQKLRGNVRPCCYTTADDSMQRNLLTPGLPVAIGIGDDSRSRRNLSKLWARIVSPSKHDCIGQGPLHDSGY